MQTQKKQIIAENEALKAQLMLLKESGADGVSSKQKYMEGAVWMGKKLSNEIEKVCQSYEFLLQEYNQRVHEAIANNQAANSASTWLIEAVKQAGFELYEKTITILESAIFHMEDAAQKYDETGRWNF